jgi:hypothetical protein
VVLRTCTVAVKDLRDVEHFIEVTVVGCSHPGIDKIVAAASTINPRVHLIAGGFHLVLRKVFSDRYLYAGLGTTLSLSKLPN